MHTLNYLLFNLFLPCNNVHDHTMSFMFPHRVQEADLQNENMFLRAKVSYPYTVNNHDLHTVKIKQLS